MSTETQANFTIVRHGQSEMNAGRILSGQLEPNPLTDLGRQQVKEIAGIMAGDNYDVILTSDVQRGHESAEIISDEMGGIEIVSSPDLRNRHFGELQGLSFEDAKKKLSTRQKQYERLVDADKYSYRFDDGMETDEELMDRFMPFLEDVAHTHSGKNVLVVSHHSVMRTLLVSQGWATYDELPLGSLANASKIVLTYENGGLQIVSVEGVEKNKDSSSSSLL